MIPGIFVTKIVLTTVRKKCSSDREKILKFEAEGREFANLLRRLEQFFETKAEVFYNFIYYVKKFVKETQ